MGPIKEEAKSLDREVRAAGGGGPARGQEWQPMGFGSLTWCESSSATHLLKTVVVCCASQLPCAVSLPLLLVTAPQFFTKNYSSPTAVSLHEPDLQNAVSFLPKGWSGDLAKLGRLCLLRGEIWS